MAKNLDDVVARQEWLNPVEDTVQKAIQGAFRRIPPNTKNFLHGTWLGHPLHVVLTDVPIGSWTAAVLLDFAESVSGDEQLGRAADACIKIGLAGAAGAAVTGMADWQHVDPPGRRIGLVHALLNVTGVALFASSLLARRNSRRRGKLLSAIGYAVAAVAADFGGSLVYNQRIGVDHNAAQNFPGEFTSIMSDAELPEGRLTRAEINGGNILLLRRGDRIFAIAETCSHLGGPLSEGKLDDLSVECPWHGSRFSLETGEVVDGPAVHRQPCLDARVNNGRIEVRKRSPKVLQTVDRQEIPVQRTGTAG